MKLLLIGLMITMVGCTKGAKPLCEVGKLGTDIVAEQIATQLQCSNQDAIKATLNAKLVELRVCDAEHTTSSVIGDIVCPRLIPGVVTIIKNKIPAEWGCTGGAVKDDLEAYLLAQCKANL